MSKKALMIFLVISLGFAILMGAGFFILYDRASSTPSQNNKESRKAAEKNETEEGIRPTLPLEAFIVNLADPGGRRYLRVKMDLELSSKSLEEEMKKRLPQVRNAILMIVPHKKYEDISTIEGKNALRDEIMVKLNSFLTTGTVTQIYLTEFVIQ